MAQLLRGRSMDTSESYFKALVNNELAEVACGACGKYVMAGYLYDIEKNVITCDADCMIDYIECKLSSVTH